MADHSVGDGEISSAVTILNGDTMMVSSGGIAEDTVVSSGGQVTVFSSGTVNGTVLVGGSLSLSGGTANNTVVSAGYSYITGGGAQLVSFFSGKLTVSSGGQANGVTMADGETAVSGGGSASGVVENGGLLQVFGGGTVSSASVNGGRFAVLDSGTVSSATVNRGGRLAVSSGGTALEIVENGGFVLLGEGAIVSFAENTIDGLIVSDLATLHSRTSATGVSIGDGGCLFVSGGVVDSAAVSSGGMLCVYDGGQVGGDVTVEDGAVISAFCGAVLDLHSEPVLSGGVAFVQFPTVSGTLTVADGAVLSGRAAFAPGASVRIDGTIVFDAAEGTTAPLFTGFSAIVGAASYTLLADAKAGIYLLASDAAAFGSPAKFGDDVLTPGGPAVRIGDFSYSLAVAGGTLYLKVADGSQSPDNGAEKDPWNNYIFDKKQGGLNPNFDDFVLTPLGYGLTEVLLDRIDSVAVDGGGGEIYRNFVGYGDESDCAKIHLDKDAKLSFEIHASDAVKFTLYKLNKKTGKTVSVSLKSLLTASLKNGGETKSKQILLEKGEYYISMQSTNAKKPDAAAFYNVILDSTSQFFVDGDDGANNWLFDTKTKTTNDAVCDDGAIRVGRNESAAIQVDRAAIAGEAYTNFVGFGDDTDFVKVNLSSGANISFTVEATDAVKFTICQLTNNKNDVVSGVKSVQSTALKLDKATGKYAVTTKALVLADGDYYLSVQSTNAKKGSDAYYSVTVNATSTYFDNCDNHDNDFLYDKKLGGLNTKVAGDDVAAKEISTSLNGKNIRIDTQTIHDESGWNNFVGYGDTADYAKIHVAKAGTASFSVVANDAAKFVICQLTFKNGVATGMKAVQTVTLKLNKTTGKYEMPSNTKACVFKEAGDYYISVQSTNANKGGNAYYNVTLLNTDIEPVAADCAGQDVFVADCNDPGFQRDLASARTDVDALASGAVSGIAAWQDEQSAWQNIASLA